jgi:hypothetical protein
VTIRADILAEANELIHGDRQHDYGPPHVNFDRIGRLWTVILGTEVLPHQVALCMAALKIARLVQTPHRDSMVDAAGYIALAAELAE